MVQIAYSQSRGGSGSSSAVFQDQLLPFSDLLAKPATKALVNYELELLPGQKFDGWYYFWSNEGLLAANLNESPEAGWLSIDRYNFTSTGCSDIVPVRFSFTAPTEEGNYETVLIDNLGNWSDLKVRIRVTSNPASAVKRSFGINTDSISYRHFTRWSPLIFSDNTCIKDYFPDLTADILYLYNPSKPWLKISPSSGQVNRNTIFDFRSYIKKNLFDSTWVIYTREFASFPALLHYYVKETEPVDYMLKFNGKNYISTGYYPNSTTKTLMFWVRFDEISLQAIGANDLLDHRFYLGITADNSLFAGLGNGYTPLTSLNLIPGKWYNMVLTTSMDADSALVYINATEVSRWKYTFSGESKASLYFGGKNESTNNSLQNPVKGLIEEVQVWEKPLSRAQIIKYMFTPPKGNESGLAIYYPFSEGWGNFTKNSVDNYFSGILYSDPVWIDSIKRPNDPSIIITSVEENIRDDSKILNLSCRPNPFSVSTEITYNLPRDGKVILELFDNQGKLVKTLVNMNMISGIKNYTLSDASLPEGIFFVKLQFTDLKGTLIKSIKIIHTDL